MPRRSNDFQRFVALIERLSASPTAKVTESWEQRDGDNGPVREIDVVITDTINGIPLRIGIECRDHARVQTASWIDELIGKYRDLPVDVVVAVSSSGFSRGARDKAARAGIRTFTLREALASDWIEHAIRDIAVGFVEVDSQLVGCVAHIPAPDPPVPEGANFEEWIVEGPFGEEKATVVAVCNGLYLAEHRNAIQALLAKRSVREAERAGRLPFDFHLPFRLADRFLVAPDGQRRRISGLEIRIAGTATYVAVTQRSFTYANKIATVASMSDSEGSKHEVTLVHSTNASVPIIRWHHSLTPLEAVTHAKASAKSRKRQPKRGSRFHG